jgi:hypothetical protein
MHLPATIAVAGSVIDRTWKESKARKGLISKGWAGTEQRRSVVVSIGGLQSVLMCAFSHA